MLCHSPKWTLQHFHAHKSVIMNGEEKGELLSKFSLLRKDFLFRCEMEVIKENIILLSQAGQVSFSPFGED